MLQALCILLDKLLCNYDFLVAIALVLKALNFTGVEKILIDALFYTTNALILFHAKKQIILHSTILVPKGIKKAHKA